MDLHKALTTALALSHALAKAEAEAVAKCIALDKADTVSRRIASGKQKRLWDAKRTAGVLVMQLRNAINASGGNA